MKVKLFSILLMAILAMAAIAGEIVFKDPTGDDKGPGEYIYPTDGVYSAGSFDLTEVEISYNDKKVSFEASVNSKLEDPWGMGTGFAVQMIFVFIDTKPGGHSHGVPGLNIKFAEGHEWDKVVILSPQKKSRVISEAKTKAAGIIGDIVVPGRTKGKGKSISGSVKLEDLGGGDPGSWKYQVVVQSNEGFPNKDDLLTRRINEFEGQHRFGGGHDGTCDPHAIDILAGSAEGSDSEKQAQFDMLKYECDDEGNATKMATLTMIKK